MGSVFLVDFASYPGVYPRIGMSWLGGFGWHSDLHYTVHCVFEICPHDLDVVEMLLREPYPNIKP